jgi:hypothetical protein
MRDDGLTEVFYVAEFIVGPAEGGTRRLLAMTASHRGKLSNRFNKSARTGKSLLIFRSGVKPLLQKYFASLPTQISSLIRTVSFRQEGRIARRHETRDGMRWTRRRQASNSEPDE